jgi:uncharacterized membrane protein
MTYSAAKSSCSEYLRFRKHPRHGTIVVFTAVMMVVLLAMAAFAVDVGLLVLARTQLQRSADAAALAAAWELANSGEPTILVGRVRGAALQFAGLNTVLNDSPTLDTSQGADVVVGTVEDFSNPDVMLFFDPTDYNAVKVRVRRTSGSNGEVPLFFARALGWNSSATSAEATAAMIKRVGGFRSPSTG